MINSSNITQYINFLFQQKNGVPAPQDVLASWANLNDEEVKVHIQTLYQHWNLPIDEIQSLEHQFEQLNAPKQTPIYTPPPPPPVSQSYQAPQQQYVPPVQTSNMSAPPAKKSNSGLIVIIICLLAIIAAGGYYFWSTKNQPATDNLAQVPTADKTVPNEPKPVVPDAPKVDTPKQQEFDNEIDRENAMALFQLMNAENNQAFDEIYAYFSPNMERYWDINYPTYDELYDLYHKSWNSKSKISQDNIRVEKVGENTYNVSLTYNAHDNVNNKKISKNVKTRYIFDKNNKIISTYGLK